MSGSPSSFAVTNNGAAVNQLKLFGATFSLLSQLVVAGVASIGAAFQGDLVYMHSVYLKAIRKQKKHQ